MAHLSVTVTGALWDHHSGLFPGWRLCPVSVPSVCFQGWNSAYTLSLYAVLITVKLKSTGRNTKWHSGLSFPRHFRQAVHKTEKIVPGDDSRSALSCSFSYLLSADVHVPHRNPTIWGAGDELPCELKVTQRLHPVTASTTQQSLVLWGKTEQWSSFRLNSLPWLESTTGILSLTIWYGDMDSGIKYLAFYNLLYRMIVSMK